MISIFACTDTPKARTHRCMHASMQACKHARSHARISMHDTYNADTDTNSYVRAHTPAPTQQWKPREESLYFLLNAALRDRQAVGFLLFVIVRRDRGLLESSKCEYRDGACR